uniref:Uncharacterized protein n=1 Tax=uncultured marine group II/III euryarchaeote AD1000_66_B03 TaxID=1457797 RepID=A0A075G144_9EURY|nr:hypothetical protein [uncultured marine group II/III euryarchaeote AD1000_66_B03]
MLSSWSSLSPFYNYHRTSIVYEQTIDPHRRLKVLHTVVCSQCNDFHFQLCFDRGSGWWI